MSEELETTNSKNTAAIVAILALLVGIITLGVNWWQLRGELKNAEADAKRGETVAVILREQRDLLGTVSVADSNSASLQATQIALNEQIATYAPDVPTLPIVSLMPSTMPPPPTNTLIPAPTDTPSPSLTQTETSTPTDTPIPTSTPRILVADSFTGNWSNEWTILSGEPFVSNDRLVTTDNVWMVVGDETWANYRIEFTVHKTYTIVSNLQSLGNYVGVRFQDMRNMIAYRWASNLADWAIIEEGNITKIPDTDYRPGHEGFPFKITIVVNDGAIEVINGPKFSTAKFPTGKVALFLTGNTTIDDFSVVELP